MMLIKHAFRYEETLCCFFEEHGTKVAGWYYFGSVTLGNEVATT